MAIWNNIKKKLRNDNNSLYEVVMLANKDGSIQGSSNLNIPIAAGKIEGYKHVNKFGFNDTVGTSFEPIYVGSENFTYPTNAGPVSVVSDSSNDSETGSGARTVNLEGLDANYDTITETITLDGINPAVSNGSFIRLFRMRVETAGSSSSAEGVITATVGGLDLAVLDPTYDNQTLQATFTVPAGKKAYLIRMQATSTKDNKAAMVGLFTRSNAPDSVFTVKQLVEVFRNSVVVQFPVPLEFPEKTDIELRGKNLGSGQVSVGGTFDIVLVDDPA